MADVVGLDIGAKTITGAVFAGTSKSFRLVDFFVEEIPEPSPPADGEEVAEDESENSVSSILKRILDERGLHASDIVASLDTKDVVVRDLKLEFVREDQIEKVIQFEAENHLITFDIEDMVLDYMKVADDGERSDVVVFAAPREKVADRLAMLKEGGVDPVVLDLDSAALFNAYTTTLNHSPDRSCLLVDVGVNTTTVCLIQDGGLRKVRSLRLGAYLGPYNPLQIAAPVGGDTGSEGDRGSDFELPDASSIESRFDEIENALRRFEPGVSDPLTLDTGDIEGEDSTFREDEPIAILTDEEYERVADDSGVAALGLGGEESLAESVGEDVAQDVADESDTMPRYDYQDFLERLGMEIQRTFAANLLRAPLDLICLTGGMAQKEEARRFFSDEFDVETITLDFEDAFEMDVDVEAREELNRLGGVAVGLAVRELGHDQCQLDFRQDEFRYERHFEKLKRPLLTMGVCLCALFLVLIFNRIADYKYWGKLRGDIWEREVQYYEAFFEAKPKKTVAELTVAAQRELKDWNEMLGERSGNLSIVLDDVRAIKEIGNVLKIARQTRKIEYEVASLDIKLHARPTKGKRNKNEPKYKVEGSSKLVLTADARGLDSEFKDLFDKETTMWEAVPQEKAISNGKMKIDLTLTPRRDYLLTLE